MGPVELRCWLAALGSAGYFRTCLRTTQASRVGPRRLRLLASGAPPRGFVCRACRWCVLKTAETKDETTTSPASPQKTSIAFLENPCKIHESRHKHKNQKQHQQTPQARSPATLPHPPPSSFWVHASPPLTSLIPLRVPLIPLSCLLTTVPSSAAQIYP